MSAGEWKQAQINTSNKNNQPNKTNKKIKKLKKWIYFLK